MCTLITVNRTFYQLHRGLVRRRILADAKYNDDGWSLVCMDPENDSGDLHIQTMDVSLILTLLDAFMNSTENFESRMWLHARAATGGFIGIQYCHGFTDLAGQFIMHNGVLSEEGLVDSFALAHKYDSDPETMLTQLIYNGETFANIFLINEYGYSIIRAKGGSLYTDGHGNFSSRNFSDIREPVPPEFCQTFEFETKVDCHPTKYQSSYGSAYWNGCNSNRYYNPKPTTSTAMALPGSERTSWSEIEDTEERVLDRIHSRPGIDNSLLIDDPLDGLTPEEIQDRIDAWDRRNVSNK